ncbi:MAG: FAD binding domain-containing protein [Hyphomicrobiales bacterium]|nr:FAD binding domain-containing protein [Hyphomicrobiales bacterium]
MKAAAFDYVRPGSLAEAVGVLAQSADAQVMAGGQSLVAMMNLRVAAPALVIDIAWIDELAAVSEAHDHVVLGAAVTHAAIEDGRVPDPSRGLMPHVAANIAFRAVRTRGTLGGSLALADPAADWPTVMAALDATVVLRGPAGNREVRATELVTGVYETVRGGDEIITHVRVPRLGAGARWGYVKICRKTGEFAHSLAAAVRDPDRGYGRVVLGATGGPPLVLTRTSQWVQGGAGSSLDEAIPADLAGAPFDDFQASLHRASAERAVRQLLS